MFRWLRKCIRATCCVQKVSTPLTEKFLIDVLRSHKNSKKQSVGMYIQMFCGWCHISLPSCQMFLSFHSVSLNPLIFMAFVTLSLQLLMGWPHFLRSFGNYWNIFFGHLLISILCMCPYHDSLFVSIV